MDGENSLSVLFVARVVSALARPLSLRVQGRTFGAPRLRPEPAGRAGASNRESRAAGGLVISGKGRRGVSPLRGGSFRRALRAEALRRGELPRTAAPAPAAAGPRRHVPMPRYTSRARPPGSRRVCRSPCERS
jgi:hypothetical protein